MKAIEWIKENKVFVLVLIVGILLLGQRFSSLLSVNRVSRRIGGDIASSPRYSSAPALLSEEKPGSAVPKSDQSERVVITDSGLSLVTKEVEQLADEVVRKAEEMGGFLVSRRLSRPQESPYAAVVVRVPADKLDEAMDYFKNQARRVVSERVRGRDVTEEYEDIEEKLATLRKTKSKLEALLDEAEKVENILEVQREIINIQDRIDYYVGRKEYLEESAQYSKIRVDISADALALPYQPGGETFRPVVVFKKAVRSLIRLVYGLGRLAIWVVVFAVVWLPVVFVVRFIRQRKKNRKGKK